MNGNTISIMGALLAKATTHSDLGNSWHLWCRAVGLRALIFYYMSFRCTALWFNIWIYSKMITSTSLVTIHHHRVDPLHLFHPLSNSLPLCWPLICSLWICFSFTLFICFVFFIFYFFIFCFILLFLFLATLDLHCCMQAFPSCSEWGLFFTVVCGLLSRVAYSCCRAQALSMWALAVVVWGAQ